MNDLEKRCHDLAVAFASYKASRDDSHEWPESEFLGAYATAYGRFSDEIRSVLFDADSFGTVN